MGGYIITVLWYWKCCWKNWLIKKIFAVSYLSYSESLYDLIIQNQVDLNPFLARKRVGH